jgi:uncharacterized membrane protein
MTGYLYFLSIHLAAFALFTGILVADLLLHKQLWLYSQSNVPIAQTLFNTTTKYTRLMGISLGVALLAGIVMMSQMHQVYGTQLWMRIKIGIVVLILLLRILQTRNSKQLKNKLFNQSAASLTTLKSRISLFQIMQLAGLVIIILLSVKKFN